MGLYTIECRVCNQPFTWFSGSMDQRCEECKGKKMNKVLLKEIAIVDLSKTYARHMGGNKIRHYKVSGVHGILGNDPIELIKAHIEKEEGPTVIEVQEYGFNRPVSVDEQHSGLALQVKDSSFILKDLPEIEKALRKRAVSSLILQDLVEVKVPFFKKLRYRLVKPLNWLIRKVNEFLLRIQAPKDLDLYLENGEYMHEDVVNYYANAKTIPLFSELSQEDFFRRRINHCTFLAVSFEEGREQEAVDRILNDLKTCYERDLILGHLCMPSTILLADTIGSGKNEFVLFCYLFLDHEKLREVLGINGNPLDWPRLPEALLLRTAVREGEVGERLTQPYEIEEVRVGDVSEEARKEAEKAFLDSIPEVNAAAERMAKKLKERK